MPLRRVLVSSLAEFDTLLKESLARAGSKTVVLFTGALDEATGKSWCPDCSDSKAGINAALEEAGSEGDVSLLEVPLVRSEYRGNAAHWARVHPAVKLRAIPTLCLWGKTAKVAELVEGECMDAARVREMVLE